MILNKRNIESIKLPDIGKPYAKIFHDDNQKGFALRATTGGAKTFIINKKYNGKLIRMNIGHYGILTAEQARKEAIKLLAEIERGQDPSKKKTETTKITLERAYNDYIATRKSLKPKTKRDYDSLIKNQLSDWKQLPLSSITRDMVSLLHTNIGEKHQARANNTLKLLRAIFNFAIYRYSDGDDVAPIIENPVMVLTKTRGWYKKRTRTSKITHQQLPKWFSVVQTLQNKNKDSRSIEISVKYYLLLLLFTGLRREEGASLIWADQATPEEIATNNLNLLDLNKKTLSIADPKNGVSHHLPLPHYLHQQLIQYRQINKSRFVFPGANSNNHIQEPRKTMKKIIEESSTPFRLHDLRRTFGTMASEIGIPHYTIKRLLNHKSSSSDVTAGYIVNDLQYLHDPINEIANHILKIAKLDQRTKK